MSESLSPQWEALRQTWDGTYMVTLGLTDGTERRSRAVVSEPQHAVLVMARNADHTDARLVATVAPDYEGQASLLAAAPDLLAACKLAESALDERIRGASEAFPQWAALLVEAHDGLRAAIARATGDAR